MTRRGAASGMMLAITLVAMCALPAHVNAKPYYQPRIPNGASVPSPDGSGSICNGVGHTSCYGGGARNPFGLDFAAADHTWTKDLCEKDSDGDGLTNGQELGDPCCTWTEGQTPLFNAALSHPGFTESVALIPEPVNCNSGSQPADSSTAEQYPLYADGEDKISVQMDIVYVVPPVQTAYIDFPFNLQLNGSQPLNQTMYMVGYEVKVDHMEYVHHMVGYSCPRPHDTLQPFDEMTGERISRLGCVNLFLLAAPGGDRLAFPLDVALPVGPGTQHLSMILQVHYNNPELVTGVLDSTSVVLHLTSSPRAHDMGIVQFGDVLLDFNKEIPPGEDSWHVTSRCLVVTPDDSDVTVFLHAPHMHWVGARLWSEKIADGGARDSENGTWVYGRQSSPGDARPLQSLGRVDAYDADLQRSYPAGTGAPGGTWTLRSGDLIATTCVYNTSGHNKTVSGGLGSQNEMCIHFMMYYPASAIQTNPCVSSDPSHAGRWPADKSSVVQAPELLQKLLEPSRSLELGYDTTIAVDGEPSAGDFAGCNFEAVMAACNITDISDRSQWTAEKLCDFTQPCANVCNTSCEALAATQRKVCSGSPEVRAQGQPQGGDVSPSALTPLNLVEGDNFKQAPAVDNITDLQQSAGASNGTGIWPKRQQGGDSSTAAQSCKITAIVWLTAMLLSVRLAAAAS